MSTTLLAPHTAKLRSLSKAAAPAQVHVDRELGRGFLRLLLGCYLGLPAAEVRTRRRCPACGGPHGPPFARNLHISVAYTTGMVAYALATSPVGIDIEIVRQGFEWQPVAQHLLRATDYEGILRVPPRDRTAAFLAAWTRREAFGKATGRGLLDAPAWPQIPRGASLVARRLAPTTSYVATVVRSTRRLRVRVATDALPSILDPAVVL